MKEFCQKEVLGYYNEELVKREKARNRFRRIEEKIQAKISIRRKGEEEANSLLVTYFENPVIAPVRIVKVEEKPLEEKKEEVVETSASKSIWSNFGEVLKRPPREVKAQIEAIEVKEDSDEGPPKLTMFDLIKSRK